MKTFKEYFLEQKRAPRGVCWKGYKMVGTKKKGNKTVPNCVPVSESKQKHSKQEAGYVAHAVKGQRCDQCTMWRAPNKCSAVAGDIKPEAWCKWWKQSHRKDLKEKSIHDPVRPGILKRQVKGKMTCSKARGLKAKQKNKGNNTAKAAQRYLNYHC